MLPVSVLILGGTAEAAALASLLDADPAFAPLTSLAGRTNAPALIAGEVRVGGFGGAEGLARFMVEKRVEILVDATHPFAARMPMNAVDACALLDRPRLILERPAWVEQAGDRWTWARSVAAAAAMIEPGRRVFLTIGRQELSAFADRPDVWFLVRAIDPPGSPLLAGPHAVVLGKGPFLAADETALMQDHAIDLLLTKNSGGEATAAKLSAARGLGVPAIAIDRPPAAPGERVETVREAREWLRRTVQALR